MGNDIKEYNEYLKKSLSSQSAPKEDDGSLSFLGLDTDRDTKMFSCPAKTQMELVGQPFWILDYFFVMAQDLGKGLGSFFHIRSLAFQGIS